MADNVSSKNAEIKERCAMITRYELAVSRLSLPDLLRSYGIDPDQPYVEMPCPEMVANRYIQRIATQEAEDG